MQSEPITIAIDAMGGDHAPQSVLVGANQVLERDKHVHFLLYGDEAELLPIVKKFPLLSQNATIHHTKEVVGNDEKPAVALRHLKNSSMRLAIDAVKDAKADGVVSAGNTGALLAMSMMVLKRLPGIERPAICSLFPTREAQRIAMLDLGANILVTSEQLFQFAVMGDAFAKTVLGVKEPRVALLNIGTEEIKGNTVVRETARLLQETNLPINFTGYIEGDNFASGVVDVVVSDGFTGNIALKTAEGTAKICKAYMSQAFRSSFMAKIGASFAKGALKRTFAAIDPRLYNGAIFLGLKGVAVKSHGGVDEVGYRTAIEFAIKIIRNKTNQKIMEELKATTV